MIHYCQSTPANAADVIVGRGFVDKMVQEEDRLQKVLVDQGYVGLQGRYKLHKTDRSFEVEVSGKIGEKSQKTSGKTKEVKTIQKCDLDLESQKELASNTESVSTYSSTKSEAKSENKLVDSGVDSRFEHTSEDTRTTENLDLSGEPGEKKSKKGKKDISPPSTKKKRKRSFQNTNDGL